MNPADIRNLHVPAGKDRHQENNLLIWGFVPLSIKINTKDSGGNLFLFEHTDMPKGGPPRHVHHDQDEWFFAIKGEFTMEIGEEKFILKPGDSLVAPRKVPHAWACVTAPGTLLTALTPAGTFETFIRETTRHSKLPTPEEINKAFSDHNMTVVGPPLNVH